MTNETMQGVKAGREEDYFIAFPACRIGEKEAKSPA